MELALVNEEAVMRDEDRGGKLLWKDEGSGCGRLNFIHQQKQDGADDHECAEQECDDRRREHLCAHE
jgi:hypothetical protein